MTAKINGGAALAQLLASLPAKLERNILRGALKAGAEEYANGARENLGGKRVKTGTGAMVLIADSVRVTSKVEPGVVTAKVQTKGAGAYVAPWLEFGTDPHFISVDAELSGGRTVSRINRLAKEPDSSHSLVIGGKFVGSSVFHTGADPYPFMRPAVDTRQAEAIAAVSNHIATKLSKEGLNAPAPPDEPDE